MSLTDFGALALSPVRRLVTDVAGLTVCPVCTIIPPTVTRTTPSDSESARLQGVRHPIDLGIEQAGKESGRKAHQTYREGPKQDGRAKVGRLDCD